MSGKHNDKNPTFGVVAELDEQLDKVTEKVAPHPVGHPAHTGHDHRPRGSIEHQVSSSFHDRVPALPELRKDNDRRMSNNSVDRQFKQDISYPKSPVQPSHGIFKSKKPEPTPVTIARRDSIKKDSTNAKELFDPRSKGIPNAIRPKITSQSAQSLKPEAIQRRYTISAYHTKAKVSRPGLDRVMSGSAFVSRMPAKGLRKDKMDWVYPAKDHIPKTHKARVVIWADLTLEHVERLNVSLNADHIKQVLADIFTLDNYKDNIKVGIIMDLYYYTLQFARKMGFSPEKTSTFFSIVKKTFEVCIETPFGNLDHTFQYFKDLIYCHSINRPPYSIELFAPDEVRQITEYTINTFFRHFKMYKYAFTPLVRLDLAISYVGMPPSPPPSAGKLTEVAGEEEEGSNHDDEERKEEDEERMAAREELKAIVKNFLLTETKKIEGTVETQVKTVVEALHTKIDTLTDVRRGSVGNKKDQKKSMPQGK